MGAFLAVLAILLGSLAAWWFVWTVRAVKAAIQTLPQTLELERMAHDEYRFSFTEEQYAQRSRQYAWLILQTMNR